jgi:hypothetical protein
MKINYIYAIRILDFVYIGQHQTENINDEYYGSGIFISKLKKWFPIQFFHKQILEIVKEEDLNYKENFYISIFKRAFNEKCLNFTSQSEKDEINDKINFLKISIEKVDTNHLKEFTEKLFLKYFYLQKDFSSKEIKCYINLYNVNNNTIKNLKKEKMMDDELEKALAELDNIIKNWS